MQGLSSYRDEPRSRASLILMLYGGMGVVAAIVAAALGDYNIYVTEAKHWTRHAASPVIGIAVGVAVVALCRWATHRFQWAKRLHSDFKSILGPLSSWEILVLAAASSIGEEFLFRGLLLPHIGLWAQALIFAALHIGPGRRFLPWTLSALAAGVGFGALAQWTGDLGAPIAAHFVVNFLNLRFIVRRNV